jgi:hypothetical protein
MKVRLFLILSLALNLYLIFVAFRRYDKKSEPIPVPKFNLAGSNMAAAVMSLGD